VTGFRSFELPFHDPEGLPGSEDYFSVLAEINKFDMTCKRQSIELTALPDILMAFKAQS
jgi:hypothetical protein